MPIKFTPIKFPLKMRGVDVRNLEDLRENFDLNAAVAYFKDGKLLKWLEARYYDDEADEISSLDENAPDFREKLCAALGVEFEGDASARVEEKKNRLRELTDDESIIYNAATTALNQEDLADLLDAGTSTIYLCGTRFSIPIRVTDKKYIGVLDPPLIKIRANSQADLDAKNISFENVCLPWDIADVTDAAEKVYQPVNQNKSAVNDELREIFTTIFGKRELWEVIDRDGKISTKEPTLTQKKMFIKMVCNGKYSEDDLIFIRVVEDFSSGFAFTKDSFCIGGDFRKVVLSLAYVLFDALNLLSNKYFDGIPKIERGIIKYADITSVNFSDWDSSLTKRQEADNLTINFALPAPEAKKFSFEDKNGKPLPAATSEGIVMEQFEQVNLWNEIDEMEHSFKIDRYKVGSHLVDRKILWQIGKFLDFAKG